jgi:hypothetical protein
MGRGFIGELYNTLFALEFPDGPPAELLAADGKMVLRPNNTFSFRPYEPEYAKYGGPAGIALAEWHFQHSSELVLHAIRTMNLHLRPILFGVAAQLMMIMSGTFLGERNEVLSHLEAYQAFWVQAFAGTNFIGNVEYERQYDAVAPAVRQRFVDTLDALEGDRLDRLPNFLQGWAAHCHELSERVRALAGRGELVFPSWTGTGEHRAPDADTALRTLLSPYMHMTNNRFNVTIRDEAYLSYLLGRALRDTFAEATR